MNPDTGAQALNPRGVHLCDVEPSADHTYRAVTIFDHGPNGVLVWVGYVDPNRRNPGADGASAGFVVTERVSFMFWDDVWTYFRNREFERLIETIRPKVDSTLSI